MVGYSITRSTKNEKEKKNFIYRVLFGKQCIHFVGGNTTGPMNLCFFQYW